MLAIGITSYIAVRSNMLGEIREKTVAYAKIAAAKIDSGLFESVTTENGMDENYYEASHEQNTYIEKVSGSVSLVAEHISAASANAEESASAASKLNGQATGLKELLDRFGL